MRDASYERVIAIPNAVPVILTNALGPGAWGQENWDGIISLAKQRGSILFAVSVVCEPMEHKRRMVSAERAYLRKLTDPSQLRWHSSQALMEEGARHLLRLDSTTKSARECADDIAHWLEDPG